MKARLTEGWSGADFVRRGKQRLVHNPNVIVKVYVFVVELLDDEIARLSGQLTPRCDNPTC